MFWFLPEEIVCKIHEDQINLYGGLHGIRDRSRLDASINAPKAQFGGAFLHPSIFHMAAAYGFGISENQPFLDGNKRTAGMVMLTFLLINGFEAVASEEDYYKIIMAVANKQMSQDQLAQWLKDSVVKI